MQSNSHCFLVWGRWSQEKKKKKTERKIEGKPILQLICFLLICL